MKHRLGGQRLCQLVPEKIQGKEKGPVRMKETLEGTTIQVVQDLHLKKEKKLHRLVPETIGHHRQESLVKRKEALEGIIQDLHLKNVKKLHRLVPETIGHHHQESLVRTKETLEDTTIQIVPIPGLQNLMKSFQWINISANLQDQYLQHPQDKSLPEPELQSQLMKNRTKSFQRISISAKLSQQFQDQYLQEHQDQSLPELQERRQLQQIQIQIQHLRQLI